MAERRELRSDITLVITQLRLQCICMALQIVQLVSQQASKKRLMVAPIGRNIPAQLLCILVFPLVDERVEWKALLETNACHSVIVI